MLAFPYVALAQLPLRLVFTVFSSEQARLETAFVLGLLTLFTASVKFSTFIVMQSGNTCLFPSMPCILLIHSPAGALSCNVEYK